MSLKKKKLSTKTKEPKGILGKNYPYLPPAGGKKIKSFSVLVQPESIYDPSRKEARNLQNLVDYREFIKK
jgi:hypothetical protein